MEITNDEILEYIGNLIENDKLIIEDENNDTIPIPFYGLNNASTSCYLKIIYWFFIDNKIYNVFQKEDEIEIYDIFDNIDDALKDLCNILNFNSDERLAESALELRRHYLNLKENDVNVKLIKNNDSKIITERF